MVCLFITGCAVIVNDKYPGRLRYFLACREYKLLYQLIIFRVDVESLGSGDDEFEFSVAYPGIVRAAVFEKLYQYDDFLVKGKLYPYVKTYFDDPYRDGGISPCLNPFLQPLLCFGIICIKYPEIGFDPFLVELWPEEGFNNPAPVAFIALCRGNDGKKFLLLG